jgi:hypothetical protein
MMKDARKIDGSILPNSKQAEIVWVGWNEEEGEDMVG